jgi:hypothetical protein
VPKKRPAPASSSAPKSKRPAVNTPSLPAPSGVIELSSPSPPVPTAQKSAPKKKAAKTSAPAPFKSIPAPTGPAASQSKPAASGSKTRKVIKTPVEVDSSDEDPFDDKNQLPKGMTFGDFQTYYGKSFHFFHESLLYLSFLDVRFKQLERKVERMTELEENFTRIVDTYTRICDATNEQTELMMDKIKEQWVIIKLLEIRQTRMTKLINFLLNSGESPSYIRNNISVNGFRYWI